MEKLFDVPLKLNKMFLRGDGKKCAEGIYGTIISTDTYYGCFPYETYADNTILRHIRVCAEIKGSGKAELHCLTKTKDRIVAEKELCNSGRDTIRLPFSFSNDLSGCLYLRMTGEIEVSHIWYEGDPDEKPENCVKETKIAILICTFYREEYVLKNLRKLARTLVEDQTLRESIEIFCIDNGGTLSDIPSGITIIKNRNYGGSGGYARGMLEAGKRGGFTHYWLMDDDIRFDATILRRAVTFMKYRRQDDIRLAAGMFSFEAPAVQVEATAVFNGYTYISNASGLDFRKRDDLLNNRVNSNNCTYGGWWSLIMPASRNLPMPFFIKMDDIEYGIRTPGKYVIMNGFGVWHEAFGKKGSVWQEYYTTRNTLIVQSLHPELPHSPVKMMGIRLLKALAYDEPGCMEAAYNGVQDYLAGAASFRAVNPEDRHKKVLKDYKSPLVSGITRNKMFKTAVKNMWKPRSRESIGLFLKSLKMLRNNHSEDEWKTLSTEEFWKDYLGLGEAKDSVCNADDTEYKPLISIIIPVYNVAEYLPKCLESVKKQTYTNLEIILIDDGSTDGSSEICDEWVKKDSRFHVVHKENGGVSSARNMGLKMATGELIGFVDSDDWTEPEMYERLEKVIRGSDAAISGFYDYPYGMDKPIPRGTNHVLPCGFEGTVMQILSRDGYYCTLWNKLFRREVITRDEEIISFDQDLSFGEDEVWLMQVFRNCQMVSFLPEPLYHWRKREGSATEFTHISDCQISLLEAKRKSFLLLPKKHEIEMLAKSKMFNDCFFLKLQAYCTQDWENFRTIGEALRPMAMSWLISNDTPILRKAKVIAMDMEMTLKMPPRIVRITDNVKKMHR